MGILLEIPGCHFVVKDANHKKYRRGVSKKGLDLMKKLCFFSQKPPFLATNMFLSRPVQNCILLFQSVSITFLLIDEIRSSPRTVLLAKLKYLSNHQGTKNAKVSIPTPRYTLGDFKNNTQ
jgi:hypothetical protein